MVFKNYSGDKTKVNVKNTRNQFIVTEKCKTIRKHDADVVKRGRGERAVQDREWLGGATRGGAEVRMRQRGSWPKYQTRGVCFLISNTGT